MLKTKVTYKISPDRRRNMPEPFIILEGHQRRSAIGHLVTADLAQLGYQVYRTDNPNNFCDIVAIRAIGPKVETKFIKYRSPSENDDGEFRICGPHSLIPDLILATLLDDVIQYNPALAPNLPTFTVDEIEEKEVETEVVENEPLPEPKPVPRTYGPAVLPSRQSKLF